MSRYSVNARPLLEGSTDSDNDNIDQNSVIVTADTKPLFKVSEPQDPYHTSYFIFYFLGITTLIPWNFLINAEEYWKYKFRDVNGKIPETDLQVMIPSYLSVATSIPGTFFLVLNTFLSKRISLQVRMVGSLSVMLILFIITTAFVKINTDEWQEEFFVLTIIIVVILSMASAICCGGLFGVVGKFSSSYITAVVCGQALGSIFAALVEIISLTLGVSPLVSAFVYFMVANITLIVALIAYIALSKSIFFKYHTIDKVAIAQFEASSSSVVYGTISYKKILKKIWLHAFSIFSLFLVTMCIYPGVTTLIESEDAGSHTKWSDVYFVPVVNYLLFGCGDYFGRIIAGFIEWPANGWILALFNLARLGFIPILLLCNIQPRQHLPVLIEKDWYYMIIMACFSLTNGYLANVTAISAPKFVEPHEREVASSMIAAFLGVGISIGAALNLFIIELI